MRFRANRTNGRFGSFTGEAVVIAFTCALAGWCCNAQQVSLAIRAAGPRVELAWPSALSIPPQGPVFPEYEVQRSADLIHWEPIGGKVRAISGRSGPVLNLTLDTQPGAYFYRVGADFYSQTAQQTGSGGTEVFGYGAQLAAELVRLLRGPSFDTTRCFTCNRPTLPISSVIIQRDSSSRVPNSGSK